MSKKTLKMVRPEVMAKELGVALSTLSRWRQQGTGPEFIKLGDRRNSPIRYFRLLYLSETDANQ